MSAETINLRQSKPEKSPVQKTTVPKRVVKRDEVPQQMLTRERGISWIASYETQHRNPRVITGFVGFLAAIAALSWYFQDNVLFALVLMMSVGAFAIVPRRPSQSRVQLTHSGVHINDAIYPYSVLSSFWVSYDPAGPKELSFTTRRWLSPYLRIPLHDQNPLAVRAHLLEYVPEQEQHHSFIEGIIAFLEF